MNWALNSASCGVMLVRSKFCSWQAAVTMSFSLTGVTCAVFRPSWSSCAWIGLQCPLRVSRLSHSDPKKLLMCAYSLVPDTTIEELFISPAGGVGHAQTLQHMLQIAAVAQGKASPA